jgi:outer membrane protein OmpA-like peptidoglycan-associated protein
MKTPHALSGAFLVIYLSTLCIPAAASADELDTGAAPVTSSSRRSRRVASEPKITTQTTTRDLTQDEDQSGTGLALFLGAGASYYSIVSQSPGTESNKSGLGYQGKAGLTLYSRLLALELDAGWMQSSVTSTNNVVSVVGNTTSVTQAQVDTRAGLVEFSPRLRFGEHFELGPSAGVLFGTNASFGTTTAQPDSPILGGLKAAMTWQTRELHFRIVAQAQSSLTIPERRVLMGSLGLELGLPLLRGKTVVRETEVHEVQENNSVEYVETEVPVVQKVEVVKEVVKEVVLFSFDDQIVHFEFDRAQLAKGSSEFVERLGRFLASNPQLWSSLKIEGHTDTRGTADYNLKLSENRAQAVRQTLAQTGVPDDRMVSRGMGLTSPLDANVSDLSHARNRRVELSFTGVSDTRALRDGINRIRFETTMPSTCADGHCR